MLEIITDHIMLHHIISYNDRITYDSMFEGLFIIVKCASLRRFTPDGP